MVDDAFAMVLCPRVLAEVRRGRGKHCFPQRVSPAQADEAIVGFAALATVLSDPIAPPPILRDPADDYLVALADLLDHPGLEPPANDALAACPARRGRRLSGGRIGRSAAYDAAHA